MTVTATQSSGTTFNGILLSVLVLNGAQAAAAQTGNTGSAGAFTTSVTTTVTGSWVLGGTANSNSGTATANASSALISDHSDTVNGAAYTTWKSAAATGTPGPTTFGITSTGAANSTVSAGAEILPNGTIAQDASTPASAATDSDITVTTASFTPPAGSLLAAVVATDSNGAVTVAVTDSRGLAWRQLKFATGASFEAAGVWVADVPAAAAAAAAWPARPGKSRLRHHHGARRQQLQQAFGSSAAAVSDADTGTGTDAGEAVAAALASADAGTGTDNGTVTAAVSDADTGTGTDAGETLRFLDFDSGRALVSRTWLERYRPGRKLQVPVYYPSVIWTSDADAGTGTDAGEGTAAALASADTGTGTDNGTVAAVLASADTGTGTETASAALASADAGLGTDAGEAVAISVFSADTGTGTDTGEGTAVSVAAADTGTGTDAGEAVAAAVADADVCGGPEGGNGKISLAAAADAGTGTDDSPVIAVLPASAETGTGTDGGETAALASADTGLGTDAGEAVTAAVPAADTGAGTETGTVRQTAADTGTGTDAGEGTAAAVPAADTGTGTETAGTAAAVPDADAGTSADGTETVVRYDYARTAPALLPPSWRARFGRRPPRQAQGIYYTPSGVTVFDADAGLGEDAEIDNPAATAADACSGTDGDGQVTALLSSAAFTSDAAGSFDNGESLAGTWVISSRDAGSGTDLEYLSAAQFAAADAVLAFDQESTRFTLPGTADAGQGTDSTGQVGILVTDPDTGHGADAAGLPAAALPGSDTGHGADAGEALTGTFLRADTDAGHGTGDDGFLASAQFAGADSALAFDIESRRFGPDSQTADPDAGTGADGGELIDVYAFQPPFRWTGGQFGLRFPEPLPELPLPAPPASPQHLAVAVALGPALAVHLEIEAAR